MTNTILVEGSGHECDVRLDTWLQDLLPITPGCVARVRRRAVVLACREFFEQSATWRVVIGPKNLVANKKRYHLSPYDAYSNVVKVFSVELNGAPLRPMLRRPAGEEPDADYPQYYFLEAPDVVRVWPMPSKTVTNGLTVYVALTPKQTVRHLPRLAASHYYDAIFDGAAGRLLSQPAKPYTDPLRAQYHLQRFRAAIGKYGAQAKMGFADAAGWSFPRFGK